MRIATLLLATGLIPLCAQDIKLPASIEKLSSKARESVEVTLDSTMLRLLAKFDKDSRSDRELLSGLDSVYVRSFEFSWEDEYKMSDVDTVRAQLQAPTWSRIVGVRSKDHDGEGNVEVYFKDGGNGTLNGIVIIAAEPRELTIVSIAGNLHLERLADLGGKFHIPKLDLAMVGRRREWK